MRQRKKEYTLASLNISAHKLGVFVFIPAGVKDSMITLGTSWWYGSALKREIL